MKKEYEVYNSLIRLYNENPVHNKTIREAVQAFCKVYGKTEMEFLLDLQKEIGELPIVTFGKFSHEADGETKPVKWRVLTEVFDKALLLSEYGLEYVPYNEGKEPVSYIKSGIRKWINEFFTKSFTDDEKESILYEPELLTLKDYNLYLPDRESKFCYPTPYAMVKSPLAYGNGAWWLMPDDNYRHISSCVVDEGTITSAANNIRNILVRPCMWVKKDSLGL